MHHKFLGNKEQDKPNSSICKEIKISAEIIEMKTKQYEEIMKHKSTFFEKIN
jgi:hypothetical protein